MATFPQQEIKFADEAVFNEQLSTWTYMIPVLSVSPSFVSGRMTDRSHQARLFRTRPGYRMPRSGGQITIETFAPGAQVDTASGALAHTWDTKLDADGLGGADLTQVGGVAGATATATSLPNRTGTGLRGGIIRVGQAGDTRAEGQAAVMGNPTTSLLTGLPLAPNATDAVRGCIMLYPKETLGASKRFLVAWADNPGMQYIFSGCQLASWGIRIAHGEPPIKFRTYSYAYWREVTEATPSASALEQCDAAVSAGGSYFLEQVGTATRPSNAEREAAEVEITFNLGLTAKVGEVPGLPLCTVLGWVRTKPQGEPAGTLRLVHPKRTGLEASYDKDGSESELFHFLATLSAGGGTAETEGRHVAIYCPRMYRINERVPPTDWSGLQYQTSWFGIDEGPDETNDLTRSFFRIGVS
jgi:hypothetical protein